MLDLARLRAFRSVVASGSIQAAATNLGYTPSAVSQQVSALQRETGLRLLARVGRGVEPTAAGTAVADRVDRVFGELGELDALVGRLRSGRSQTLALGYFASVGAAWMPHVVAGLTRDFPEVELRLRLDEVFRPDPAQRLDIQLLVERPDFAAPAGYLAERLYEDEYVVALPAGHPLAGRERLDLAELSAQRWIDNDFDQGWCRQVVIEACAAAGFIPPFHVQTHDYPSALAFVANGVGITVLPCLGARTPPPGVETVPVGAPRTTRTVHALVLRSSEDLPATRRALELLREQAQAAGDDAARAARSGGPGPMGTEGGEVISDAEPSSTST